jgi:hypothetical protein
MRLAQTIIFMLPFLAACSGVQVLLKNPVESKCGSAGLKGCPEMTEGVLLYVEGKEPEGKDKLIKGANENTPDKVKEFAKQLHALKEIPGAQKYTKKIVEVADILATSAKDGKGGKGGKGGAGAPGDNGAPAAGSPNMPSIGETNAVAH